MKEIKLAIGEPHVSDRMYSDFHRSWVAMQIPMSYNYYIPEQMLGEFSESISAIRNHFVMRAIDEKITHLLMVDTDQVYPPDTIVKLVGLAAKYQGSNVGAFGGLICRRYPPYDPLLYKGVKGGYNWVDEKEWKSGEVIEVDATGTGCLMFDMRVFEKIPYPWFEAGWVEDVKTGKLREIGEDINLCSKLRESDWRILVDSSLKIGHISQLVVDTTIREVFKGLNNLSNKLKLKEQSDGKDHG